MACRKFARAFFKGRRFLVCCLRRQASEHYVGPSWLLQFLGGIERHLELFTSLRQSISYPPPMIAFAPTHGASAPPASAARATLGSRGVHVLFDLLHGTKA